MSWSLIILGLFYVVVFVYYDYMNRQQAKEWAKERSELLNRIKPETAQIPNVDQSAIFDPVRNDEDFWNAHENLIKEEGTYPYGFEEENRGR